MPGDLAEKRLVSGRRPRKAGWGADSGRSQSRMEAGKESGGDARTERTLGHTREHGREGPRCMREREQRGSWTRTDPGGSPSQPRRSALQPRCPLGPVPEEPRRHTWPEQRRRAGERGVQRALSAKSGQLSGSVRLRGVGNDAALRATPSNVLSRCLLSDSLCVRARTIAGRCACQLALCI